MGCFLVGCFRGKRVNRGITLGVVIGRVEGGSNDFYCKIFVFRELFLLCY